jgi:hypothetical protein
MTPQGVLRSSQGVLSTLHRASRSQQGVHEEFTRSFKEFMRSLQGVYEEFQGVYEKFQGVSRSS